jgi:putative Ca2+/H+ antiporter (TMEM165/GDT1 family)
MVIAGTTAGMLLANVPAVLVGRRLAERLPMRRTRQAAAAAFVLMGIVTLVQGIG